MHIVWLVLWLGVIVIQNKYEKTKELEEFAYGVGGNLWLLAKIQIFPISLRKNFSI